ncbi:BTB domain-containing protein [Mycena sanguinolenta]|uniref:BTB domain-containing protein n=1 Tax=Mycena sanguinolenta TaxID=230812 RepID=A0A8H6XW15_9AGAR|nr:BTB domain-containing protein [Mycena sanguinolenta]
MDTNPASPSSHTPNGEPQGLEPAVNDDTYFFDDGDCVFVVEGYFFKVHKVILSRDPESMFRIMFTLPQGSAPHGKELDPIVLSGDSADEFRSLCWALYALPTEIQAQNHHEADIERLVVVAKMAHKYSLSSFETWALSMIRIHSQSERDYLDHCPQNLLDGVYEAAAAGGCQDLCELVEEKWLARLKHRELHLRHALDFGETHDMRPFLVSAYYQQAQDMQSFAPRLSTGSEITDFSCLNLTHSQLHRLLSGYCSLSLFWETCIGTSFQTCASNNNRYHKSTMHDILIRDPKNPLDILGGLKNARQKAEGDFNCSCRKAYIDKLISGFSISNHFR